VSLEPPPGSIKEFNHAWVKWLNGLRTYVNDVNGGIFDLSALTATVAELNYNDVTTPGTAEATKTVTTDANKDITGLRNVTLTGNIGFGGQLSFPASVSASTDANTLDDYEEGTFTPVLSDGSNNATASVAVGSYRKIGDAVFIKGYILVTSLGSVSGSLRLTGLPFTSSSTANTHSSVSFGYGAVFSVTAGYSVSGIIDPGTSYINVKLWDDTAGTTDMQHDEWTTDGRAMFSGFYTV